MRSIFSSIVFNVQFFYISIPPSPLPVFRCCLFCCCSRLYFSSLRTLRPSLWYSVSEVDIVMSIHTPDPVRSSWHLLQTPTNVSPSRSFRVSPADSSTAENLTISVDTIHKTKRTRVDLHQLTTNVNPTAASSITDWSWKNNQYFRLWDNLALICTDNQTRDNSAHSITVSCHLSCTCLSNKRP